MPHQFLSAFLHNLDGKIKNPQKSAAGAHWLLKNTIRKSIKLKSGLPL
jgi:hypothetical protein